MHKITRKLYIATFAMTFFANTGVCAPQNSDLTPPTLQDRYAPDNLQIMKKPSAFQGDVGTPYDEMMLHMEAPSGGQKYNPNCQFGNCYGEPEEIGPDTPVVD